LDRTEAAYLESVLAGSVNDVAFREALHAGRGMCAVHCRAVLDADRRRSGSLGAAILLRAILTTRLRDLDAARATSGRTRARRLSEAARPPSCPACARLVRSDAGLLEGLAALMADPAWSAAMASAAFCLEHLVGLLARRPATGSWSDVESRQLERLRDLGDRLDGFAHTSSHDRADLQTDEQRAALDTVADLLAGRRGRGERDRHQ
ncbi:MAG: hypothetical protein Q8M74_00235, partial [Chloroflexota bacterium]|nr:hypothetical protein [Chloroflexota bacterium]